MYTDRADAGRALASAASGFEAVDPLVLAIPRGGVVVARELAAALGADLDVVMAKKIGAPFNPEFAVAAVDPDGEIVTFPGTEWAASRDYVLEQAAIRKRDLEDSLIRFRAGRKEKPLAGRTVFLVDDGLATGLTAIAAVQYVRRRKPREIILAVPVAPEDTLNALRPLVDDAICPLRPPVFYAVSEWYISFEQVDDQDVIKILEEYEAKIRGR